MTEDTDALRRRARARAQLLHRPAIAAADALRWLVAVQAQDARSARLALRARTADAGLDAPEFVVTWLLRGTLHLVHRADLPWLHALAPPPSARRLRDLGVDESSVARVAAALPFTRADAGAVLGLSGQALPYALHLAASRGVCVSDLSGRFVAASIPPVPRADALAELRRRYALAHPCSTPADLAAWAGIPLRDAAPGSDPSPLHGHPAGEGSDPSPVGVPAASPAGVTSTSPVPPRLLPPFDPYVLGWRDRSFAVPDRLRARVFPGGGMFRATATVDGQVVGTWTAPRGRVVLDDGDPALFAEEVADVERLLSGLRRAP